MPAFLIDEALRWTGEVAKREESQIVPNETQRITLIIACIYTVAIAILWHIPILSWTIYPFKLLTVGLHEFSHALAGKMTCAKVESIRLDPHEGGETRMRGGISAVTLPAGYLGSSLIGAALIACGFNTVASKICCLVLAAVFLLTLFWARRDWLTWVLILCMAGLIVGFWFINHGVYLRFIILFIGVMSCLYSVWDIIDDTISRKLATSDASQFADLFGCLPARGWGVVWLLISVGFFAVGLIIGIVAFKDNEHEQLEASDKFIPTR